MALDRRPAQPLDEEALAQAVTPVTLVVGFPNSVHTARWINMVQGRGIRFVLVPSYDAPAADDFTGTCLIRDSSDLTRVPEDKTPIFDLHSVPAEEIAAAQEHLDYQEYRPPWLGGLQLSHPAHLAAAIRRLDPVLIHSMVVQFGGYLCFACKKYLGEDFPPWLLSNWGSDIYLFRKLPGHGELLREILASVDAYHAECERDVDIAHGMGFRGFTFPVMPATGGVDFHTFPSLDSFRRPSERREILVKGYHGWSGRGLHVLAAVHLAADALRSYKMRIALAGPEVRQMTASVAEHNGLDIAVEPYLADHRDALLRLGNCRLVVGSGISDGISTTLLEAMSVGTFPIQSSCSCGNEWVESSQTGMLVSPSDIRGLAEALRRAATDDDLVDSAALVNRCKVEARWHTSKNSIIALDNYRALIASVSDRHTARRRKVHE
jgi:glycosyltransferase involved in cell wall biosynthesis